jgi:hypothetical protein
VESAATVSVTSSDNPSAYGEAITFTATVAGNMGTPTGSVQFTIDGSNFGLPVQLVGGSATSAVSSTLGVGPHTVAAVYSGDATYNGSTSPPLTQTVNQAIQITARQTVDSDGNGKIDAIRILTSANLNDDFGGLNITVVNTATNYTYTVIGYDTGATANDNEFFVRLAEGPDYDTGATPVVQVVAGGNLGLAVDPQPVTATDAAPPVLVGASWYSSGAGVQAGGAIYLTFSEPVTSNSALAGDFGLPVSGDTFGTGASVSNGQNAQNPNMLTITLGRNPKLTPGGLYSPNLLTAGSPTGIYVANGARIVDAAQNTALVQTVGQGVDLAPGTENISICWDDLTITPRSYNAGAANLGTTFQIGAAAFPPNGLIAVNNGNMREKFTASCSGASPNAQPPYVWSLAPAVGQDQFTMLVNGLNLGNGPQDIATQLYSGYNAGFSLELDLPTSVTTGAGAQQLITVTITATKD